MLTVLVSVLGYACTAALVNLCGVFSPRSRIDQGTVHRISAVIGVTLAVGSTIVLWALG